MLEAHKVEKPIKSNDAIHLLILAYLEATIRNFVRLIKATTTIVEFKPLQGRRKLGFCGVLFIFHIYIPKVVFKFIC